METSVIAESDLAACSREPIHLPGAIQPHGALLFVSEGGHKILLASENSARHFGQEPGQIIGRTLHEILPGTALDRLEATSGVPLRITTRVGKAERHFDVLIHRGSGGFLLEFEPARAENPGEAARFLRTVQRAIDELQAVRNQAELFAACARVIARLTGFERVMVYKFDPEWNGQVVGEELLGEVDSYMGLHFPASDIPDQARALYARTPVRLIPDSSYQPARLEPEFNPLDGRPLDLSDVLLRSVSPVHLEYLRNMDVLASMSISLKRGDRLWGLIACHHRSPRFLPYSIRAACELLGRIMSVQIGVQEESDRLHAQLEARSVQTRFFEFISDENNFVGALEKYTPTLLEMMRAEGAAILTGKHWTRLGSTPEIAQLDGMLPQIERSATEGIFHTDALATVVPEATAFRQIASGVLYVALSATERNSILFFRPEVSSVIEWAGNPTKTVEEGTYRLHPRKSFAAWQQIVTGKSLPWKLEEIEGALELRRAFNATILQRTDRLLRLSTELEQKNTDLNSFAHIAAHDLKEPVRGIHHYTSFVLEDHAAVLPKEGREMLEQVQTLAVRIDELLASLLHFSAIGRVEISAKPVPLDQLLDEVLQLLQTTLAEAKAEIRRPDRLPIARCDRALTREIFLNLITNALKYNHQPQRRIEIGTLSSPAEYTVDGGPAALIYVRDNGIGIHEKHQREVFTMFRRLHERDKFGGGTGAGLAIVKSIVEKQGGRVWIKSAIGEGATFFFTLPQANPS